MTMEAFLKKTGKNVTAVRKSQSLLQREAAEQSGISYRYYQSIETGKANITISTLFRLARFYRVHPCDLLPDKD